MIILIVIFLTVKIITMKFYNRKDELSEIKNIIKSEQSEFVYLYGRRRIGKTTLILKATEKNKRLYFFVWEKTKKELLLDFNSVLQKELGLPYLKFDNLKDLLAFLFDYSKKEKLIVIFDEFQNFYKVDKWIFFDFQYFWDLNKTYSKIKLFVLGSHFTLMKEIFENNKNPLFGRKTAYFYLKNFDINTQITILSDKKKLKSRNLLYFFSIFFGIPKYIEIYLDKIDTNKDFLNNILDIFIKENSFFLFEAKELFALEFWKSYDIYFSILTAISCGYNQKSKIADFTGINVDSLWLYLNRLEKYFELIDRKFPITETKKSKISRYVIKDLFLKFWFRYIYKYNYLLEIKDFEWLKNFIKEDINKFLWFTFEELVKQLLIEENLKWNLPFQIQKIWTYFNRSGKNEIDLILLNSKEKKVLFIECKLNKDKIDKRELIKLKKKVEEERIYTSYKRYYGFASVESQDIVSDYSISIENFIENH